MTREELSQKIYDSTNRMHDKATQIYDKAHGDNGYPPQDGLDNILDAFLKMAVHSFRVEVDTVRTLIKEYNETKD
jgi:hypothetical protein